MPLARRFARPLLASAFAAGGLDSVWHTDTKLGAAEKVTGPLAQAVPSIPDDPNLLVKINGGVQIGAALLLSMGKMRRVSALVLIASVIPTTYAGHRFWEETDEQTRKLQLMNFLKNLGLVGGLILEAVDTEGAPSVGWRARRRLHLVTSSTPRLPDLHWPEAKESLRGAAQTMIGVGK